MVRLCSALIIMFLGAGCATPKPILYPNAHLQEVGEEVAGRDIDECREMAKDAGATESQGRSGQYGCWRCHWICQRRGWWSRGWLSRARCDGWGCGWCDSGVPARTVSSEASEQCL
jgi:hypothetical protein